MIERWRFCAIIWRSRASSSSVHGLTRGAFPLAVISCSSDMLRKNWRGNYVPRRDRRGCQRTSSPTQSSGSRLENNLPKRLHSDKAEEGAT